MHSLYGKFLPVALYVLLATHTALPLKHGPEITANTLRHIRQHEQLRLHAYPDPASPRADFRKLTGLDEPSLSGAPWTVGYGETGPHVTEGTKWSERRAEMALEARVEKLAQKLRTNCSDELTQEQFDALISFGYNVGSGVFNTNAKICQLVKHKNFNKLAKTLRRFSHANGQEVPGLVTRRLEEIALFNRG